MSSRAFPFFIFCVLLGILFSPLQGENTDLRFRRLTINDGLSLSSVYCIYQDSKGFMWFGTEDGLNKYDGQNFTVYRAIPGNPNGISHKWIELIFEDSHGILWFGSRGGLTRFDPVHEQFTQYRSSEQSPHQLTNDTVMQVLQVSDSILLAGTFGGIDRINMQTLESSSFSPGDLPERNRVSCMAAIDSENYIIAGSAGIYLINNLTGSTCQIILDPSARVMSLLPAGERIWIGTEKGLFYCTVVGCDNSSEKLAAQEVSTMTGISIEQILPDGLSEVWVAAPQGLFKINAAEITELVIPTMRTSHSLALIPGSNLHRDSVGSIWYATHGEGIYRINKKEKTIKNFRNNPCDNESLSENAINCIYEDQSGSIWFGTFGAGISIYNRASQKFTLLRNDPTTKNTLASNFVWTIFEDRQGDIWVGSNDKGISVYSPGTGQYLHYDHQAGNPNSLSNSSVRKIYEDSEGTIWIGTDGGGLNRFNRNSKSFMHYQYDPRDPKTISDNSVRAIYEDREGTLWIGTRNGLNRFDKKKGTFKRYLHDPGDDRSISHNFIYSTLYQDHHKQLWIGTYGGGLNKMDMQTEEFEHYMFDPNDPNSISDNIVFSLIEDSAGIFWIGTNSRLNRFDPATGHFSHFGLAEGLPNEVIYGVVPDDQGNLWLSTNYGICRFNPRDSSTVNYDYTHGLQSNEFNGGAYHRGRSGKIYFGGVYGLNIIDPGAIVAYHDHSKLVVNRMEILGDEVHVRQSGSGRNKRNKISHDTTGYFFPEHISYANEIVLDYSIRYFSLEFADLGNMNAPKINYAYFMEGLDTEWHQSGNRNFVSYANMQPGSYQFRVRSQQPDGSWNRSVAKLNITITPPFWRTRWFLLLEILITLAVAFFIYAYLLKLRTYRILQEQNEKINQANKKLTESEQNLKLMNATKDKFFSIISHDLKNPFTSLLSISETMKESFDTFEEEEKKTSMQKINASIKTIYNLLENLLTWSRTQTGRMHFSPEKFNLSQLLSEDLNLYAHTAARKRIRLEKHFEDPITVFADRNMINTVLRNLLNNSLKFTPAGKVVEAGVRDLTSFVEVYFRDEGVGISEEDQQKLFRIDQKLKSVGTEGERGTGLGLIICREFVEKNGGKIMVKSAPGKGSTFSFTIPTTG
jgi:signal transduction histidine kinase/ligand-binding sensor domain-containing protein